MAEINPDSLIKIREELYKKLPEFMKKLGSVQKIGSRPIREIAKEIKSLWHPVNYAAQPYLDSMLEMDNADDTVGADDGHGIILYFLNNASGFKGADAKRIKAELKSLLK